MSSSPLFLPGCSLWMWLLGGERLRHGPLLYRSEHLRYTPAHSWTRSAHVRVLISASQWTVRLLCVFVMMSMKNQAFDASLLSSPSRGEPDNTFRWPRTTLGDWFSSVTSSAYWVISPWVLLVSCVPGASQSSLDLPWHLTWASGWSYGGARVVRRKYRECVSNDFAGGL